MWSFSFVLNFSNNSRYLTLVWWYSITWTYVFISSGNKYCLLATAIRLFFPYLLVSAGYVVVLSLTDQCRPTWVSPLQTPAADKLYSCINPEIGWTEHKNVAFGVWSVREGESGTSSICYCCNSLNSECVSIETGLGKWDKAAINTKYLMVVVRLWLRSERCHDNGNAAGRGQSISAWGQRRNARSYKQKTFELDQQPGLIKRCMNNMAMV